MPAEVSFNPFPGLRPYEADEDHLFFGREKQVDELLARLRTTRFLSVVGTSGSGKSSLIRSGLIPSLYSGFMARAGSTWRIAVFRPGEDPIVQMAAALSRPDVLGRAGDLAEMSRVLVETTLRRGSLGLVEAVREARIPLHENILVFIDQFEELFRFRHVREVRNSRDEAAVFVKLLLEAASQHEIPIYVVLTMRSDFLGDCMQFAGLPEAVTAGQYLVPQMSREELRSAITGPVAVARGQIAPRLVVRLLNDVNDDPDQLPVLQHALMRTWDYWSHHRAPGEPIDIPEYEAIGTMRRALSLHAEEAYEEAGSDEGKRTVERMFKALTDTFTDPRGIRRPTSIHELAEVCDAGDSAVMAAVELFRRPGRSFLMPPAAVPLASGTIVDISHESVMRCWDRLKQWSEEERASATNYVRLSRDAAWYEEGNGDLWRGTTLEVGLQWRQNARPNAAWARRYDPSFDRAMALLDRSREERERVVAEQARAAAEKEQRRKRELRRARIVAAVMGGLLAIAGISGVLARIERNRAEDNFHMANQSVDAMLKLAGSEATSVAAEVPQVEALRKQLADTARQFFLEFIKQKPGTDDLRRSVALAHTRLADISRILQNSEDAIKEYRTAIEQLEPLVRAHPGKADYKQLLATAYNWLGESERVAPNTRPDALKAYDSAITLQRSLMQVYSADSDYRRELARTLYNRGIARSSDAQFESAEADYQAAIGLLEPLASSNSPGSSAEGKPEFREDLARVYNNLSNLLKSTKQPEQARQYMENAIGIHEALTRQYPDNRDYTLELAEFYGNLGILLQSQKQFKLAELNNQKAMTLFEKLASPAPVFTAKLAYSHTEHGRILESQGDREGAAREYQAAIGMFAKLEERGIHNEPQEFFLQYGDSLLSLGNLWYSEKHFEKAVTLLAQAAKEHAVARAYANLAYDYYRLTQAYLDLGLTGEAARALDNLSMTLSSLPEAERTSYENAVKDLEKKIHPARPNQRN
jgi:tetratricopeptide (TPR) repeat protein